MSHPHEPLKTDPTELRITADHLDGQASGFRTAHHAAQSRASKAALGSGSAAAALPGMLAAWEADGAKFGGTFAKHAQGHRDAADAYLSTDAGSADRIDNAGSAP
ncbi:type VII secretion target [Mycolicibacterium baixiangningiae]|uniref:type VII secretion target n=1 Tax=Mycolicibacterium baixiangningiae TaxID=2761578 RepID=UPI001865F387|nr:type VII secretion target [Mycolicibacterium baixiangningiae]